MLVRFLSCHTQEKDGGNFHEALEEGDDVRGVVGGVGDGREGDDEVVDTAGEAVDVVEMTWWVLE